AEARTTMSTANPVSGWLGRHLKVLVLILGGMMIAAFAAIWYLDEHGCQIGGECGALTRLDTARDANSFEYAVWRASSHPLEDTPFLKPGQPTTAAVSITPLRSILFIDSLVLVPGYAGLLLIY